MNAPLVIVGSGAAGYGALRALRRFDRGAPVVVITADDGAAWSKSRLAGSIARAQTPAELVLASAAQMAHRFDATIRTATRVLTIDRGRRVVVTDRGEQPYRNLVLGVGAEPRRPALRGSAGRKVLTLSTLADLAYFRSELSGRGRVAVLGGAAAGCEFAAELARAGCSVDLLEPANRLLSGALPGLCAERLARALANQGVRLHLEDGIQRVDHGVDELELTTLAGERFRVDVVLATLGSRPRVELARGAGLEVGRGIVVDRQLRTSDPGIFAIGGCAELASRPFHFLEDIDEAARVLGAVLAGMPARIQWQPRVRRLILPFCPVAICDPPPVDGEWREIATPGGVTARFHDLRGEFRGFALVGAPATEAEHFVAELGGPAS